MSSPTILNDALVYLGVGNSLRLYRVDATTGDLTLRQTLGELEGVVQFVAVHPSGKALYASCSETARASDDLPASAIVAFAIDPRTGTLARLGAPFVSPLSRAVHLTVDNTGRYLLLAHNLTESVSVVALAEDGRLGGPIPQPRETHGLGFLVHQIRIDPSNTWVMVPVRGEDTLAADDRSAAEPEKRGRLVVFAFDDGVLTRRDTIDYPPGFGPRHLDYHPARPLVYVSMERGNRLLAYRHERGVLTELFAATTLAFPSLRYPDQRAGAIVVHPSGRWVYVANRNISTAAADRGPEGGENDIAVFAIDAASGAPTLVQNEPARGFEARALALDPTGRFLFVANQKEVATRDGNKTVTVAPNLSVFRIGGDGTLSWLRTVDVPGEAWWVGAMAPASED